MWMGGGRSQVQGGSGRFEAQPERPPPPGTIERGALRQGCRKPDRRRGAARGEEAASLDATSMAVARPTGWDADRMCNCIWNVFRLGLVVSGYPHAVT